MAETDMSLEYFDHLIQFQLAICKRCRYAVWPEQIKGHLQKQHKIRRKEAALVEEGVRSWPGLIQYPSELELPSHIMEPFTQLPLYSDGFVCQLEPTRCQRIYRSTKAIKRHWNDDHDGWSAAKKRGRPSRMNEKSVQAQIEEGCRRVYCQRFFGSRHGSQYFEVRQPAKGKPGAPEPVPIDGEAAWAQVRRAAAQAQQIINDRAQRVIEAGEKDECNPWLDRTQWLPYLVGLERPDLLACIEEPNVDPKKEEEPVEAAIWEAMGELVRISQRSVITRTGVFVRMEAIRTEKHQTRFHPLQPYTDEKTIQEHARPWKQIVMFFARTQREHGWKSPRYRFTRRQRDAWEVLWGQGVRVAEGEETDDDEGLDGIDIEEEGAEQQTAQDHNRQQDDNQQPEPAKLSGIQRACLQFCIELLNQRITRKEYDSALVCALAVLGVKEDGWKGPERYPPILSSVIKVARFMVVQQALELSEPYQEDEFTSDSAYDSDGSQPSQERKGCLQFVADMVDSFMVRGTHSPMQWMLDLRTYGLKIHYNTTARGHVEWMGQDELLYKDLQFTMPQFRSMVHGLVVESRRILMEDLLFSSPSEPVPHIPWDQLRDNPTDTRPGWNFLQDHRTQLPVDGKEWLFNRIGRDATIRRQFMKPDSQSGVRRQGVEQYMDRVIEFREKLSVLMHIAGGQPARGPELLSVRHSNTMQGGHRNIFIEDGMVVFVTRYHKGYTVSGDVKIIHRYLPREVGELLVWYLWIVLPFQQQMEAVVWEKETMSSHLWPADPSGKKWTSERFRHALKRESRVGLGLEFTIQAYREIAIGISRRFMRGSTAFSTDEGEDNEERNEENAAAAIADEQAGHTSHVAGLIYARGLMEQAGAVADRRQQFRASSIDWHQFLGFASPVDETHKSRKRKRAPFESEAEEGRIDRWARLRRMNASAQVKRMMGEHAEFRGIQEEAITAIIRGESPVVAVMPTGSGKSLLFMLPAWAEQGGTTIVVVPLLALRGDMKRRCKKLGISCAEWDRRRPPDAAAIVLVTPEAAVEEEFITFINRLRATQQLDRIVIDECHMVLNRQYTFRKQMQQLGKLVVADTQMVLLTATLPPSQEEELYRRMHFDRHQVKMSRASTVRTNIAYRVVRVGRGASGSERERIVIDRIQRRVRKVKKGRVVVYCNTVRKVQQISQALGCGAYYHDAIGKVSMLEEFTEGKQRVIVATSALGMGVDIPDIRCIIHADPPRTLLDYAQESGRAGRDGLQSEAIVIIGDANQQAKQEGQTEEEHRLVYEYLHGEEEEETCRRVVLGRYLDREEGRVDCKEGEEACDVCRGVEAVEGEESESEQEEVEEEAEDKHRKEQEEIRYEFQQQEQDKQGPRRELMQTRINEFSEAEWLRQQVQKWAGRCGPCEAVGIGDSRHSVRKCWRQESRDASEIIKIMEEKIQFEEFSGCFWCGLPQEICNRWEENGRGRYKLVKGRFCQYEGVLMAGLFGIMCGYESQIWERWAQRLGEKGVNIESREEWVRYLGKKQVLEVIESNNLVGEFCWITRLLAE